MTHSLLWILPKWIWPADDGSKVATTSLIRSLTHSGVSVDILSLHGPQENPTAHEVIQNLGVGRVYTARRSMGGETGGTKLLRLIRSFLTHPHIPLTVTPFLEDSVRLAVLERATSGYSHVVFEGLHPAATLLSGSAISIPHNFPKVIYRAQNCEWKIWERAATLARFLPLRHLLSSQGRKMRELESALVARCAGVAAVSEEDASLFHSSFNQNSSIEVVPVGFDFNSLPAPISGDKIKLLFLGRLDWPPNKDGLEWFLKSVWPKVVATRQDLSLTIAGSGNGKWLARFRKLPHVNFIGRVEDVSPLYRTHALAIAPIFYGSGTRIKVIEAAQFGRAVLSTTLGVEGTGFRPMREYLSADRAEDWHSQLCSLEMTKLQQLGNSARCLAEQRFSHREATSRFLTLLDRVITSKIKRVAP